MARTKITSNVLAPSAAQTNINDDGSFTLSVPTQINNTLSLSGNLTVDTNTLFVDSVNNRVGIGTTTPTAGYILDVVGAAKISGNILCGGSILYLNSQQSLTQGTNSLTLGAATYFTTINYGNASTTIHNFVSGNVGIGTATPNEKLHIYDSVDAHLKIAGADTAGSIRKLSLERSTGGAEIHFNEDTRTTQGLTLNTTNAAYPMSFQINGDTKMFVSTAGSVGIGTTTPTEKLTVAGNISVTGNISATGHFSAATKSFKIPHQSKGGHLQYGVVESDCHSVLVRGKISSDTITLPDHWSWLVDADSVTVQLTPVGCYQQLYVISSDNQTVKVGGVTGEYCYVVYGTRKDVAPLEVEIE